MWNIVSMDSSTKLWVFLVMAITIVSVFGFGHARDEDKTTKIVGGRFARKDEVPYIVSIHGDWHDGKGNIHYCGGSVYNKKFIITAAHCFDEPANLTGLTIIAGTLNTKVYDKGAQVIPAKKFIVHPDYNLKTNIHDIAVIELSKELQFSSSVSPIPIPSPSIVASGSGTVSGWGVKKMQRVDSPEDKMSDKLMTAVITIVPKEECGGYYDRIPLNEVTENSITNLRKVTTPPPESTMCAGYMPEGGRDACQGDSGGPLQCSRKVSGSDKPEKYLCGVVSSGYGCGLRLPGAYTEVSKFYYWIVQTAGPPGTYTGV